MGQTESAECPLVSRAMYRVNAEQDCWVPACGGREVPFLCDGVQWLYVWNPKLREHKYLNLATDTLHDSFRGEA